VLDYVAGGKGVIYKYTIFTNNTNISTPIISVNPDSRVTIFESGQIGGFCVDEDHSYLFIHDFDNNKIIKIDYSASALEEA
jgi:hypothetical protein